MRPKKTEQKKLLDKAGTLYCTWQELEKTSEDDVSDKRNGNKKMGRPNVLLSTLRMRAKTKYTQALEALSTHEKSKNIEASTENDVILRGHELKNKGPGRPRTTEAGAKFQHLRRLLVHLKISLKDARKDTYKEYSGAGRRPMDADEKIRYCEAKVEDTERDIEKTFRNLHLPEKTQFFIEVSNYNKLMLNRELKACKNEARVNEIKTEMKALKIKAKKLSMSLKEPSDDLSLKFPDFEYTKSLFNCDFDEQNKC